MAGSAVHKMLKPVRLKTTFDRYSPGYHRFRGFIKIKLYPV
jgi:hypothetical protein